MQTELAEQGVDRESMGRIKWPSDESLDTLEIYETAWTLPEIKHLALDEYLSKFGDPAENGRGDKKVKGPGGIALVSLSSEQVWTKTKRVINQAVKRRSISDGSDDLMSQCQEQNWAALKGNVDKAADCNKQADCDDDGDDVVGNQSRTQLHGDEDGDTPSKIKTQSPAKQSTKAAATRRGTPQKPQPTIDKAATKKKAGPGRRRCNNLELLEASLVAFAQVQDASNVKFFGGEWKNVKRNWDSYLKGVSTAIEEEEDDRLCKSHQVLEKRAKVVQKVLTKVHATGLADVATVRCYDEQVNWLRMEPSAPNPFPLFFRELMHSQGLANVPSMGEFWGAMENSVLEGFCSGSDIAPKQLKLLEEKLALLTMPPAEMSKSKNGLVELCNVFHSRGWNVAQLTSGAIEHLSRIVLAPSHPPNIDEQDRIVKFDETELEIRRADSNLGQSLLAYGNGRTIFEGAARTYDGIKKRSVCKNTLRTLIDRVLDESLAADDLDILGIDAQIKHLGADAARSIITLGDLTSVKTMVAARVKKFLFDAPWEAEDTWKCSEFLDLQARLGKLASAAQMHSLHAECTEEPALYLCIQSFLNAIKTVADDDGSSPGSSVYVSLRMAGKEAVKLKELLKSMVGDNDLEARIVRLLASPRGRKIMAEATTEAQPAIEETRKVLGSLYDHVAAVDVTNQTKLGDVVGRKREHDLAKAYGIVRAVPGHEKLADEICWFSAFDKLVVNIAAVALDWEKHPERKDKKISAERVAAVVTLRFASHDFQGVVSKYSGASLFQPPIEAENAFSLGTFDISKIDDFLKVADQCVEKFVRAWVADLEDLAKLVESYVPVGWGVARPCILHTENEATLKLILENPKKTHMGKSSTLLGNWRKLIKKVVSPDGLPVLLEPQKFLEWSRIEKDAADCFQFSIVALMVCKDLPGMRNKPQRIIASRKFMGQKMVVDIGADLEARLAKLADGSYPEKSDADADEGDD